MGIDWKKLGDDPKNMTLDDFEQLARQLDESDFYAIKQLFNAVCQIADVQNGKLHKINPKHRKKEDK
tara:strand:- start:1142 stop:1342 length:201 start_codon:yes stop_codon:yes gene_type:complete